MDSDPLEWRPQAFGRRPARHVADPVIEPAWDGIRVLAHLDAAAAHVAIRDTTGVDLAPEYAPIAEALLAALAAETAVVDGYLTDQATQRTESRTILKGEIPTFGEHASQLVLGGRGAELMSGSARLDRLDRLDRLGRPRIPERDGDDSEGAPIAFVAVDLVSLDGQTLVEIPLLERKRLLESVLSEGALVRRTPYVRYPAGPFILTWRSFGFGGLAYKAANSRYRPGAANDDWCLAPMPRR